jgi:hypothetical protein
MVEVIVVVAILAGASSFAVLEMGSQRRPEILWQTGKSLATFLRTSAAELRQKGEAGVLLIDPQKGRFQWQAQAGALQRFELHESVELVDVFGISKGSLGNEAMEIPWGQRGLEESLRFSLAASSLEPIYVTWNLSGRLCHLHRDDQAHWRDDVERF